MRDLRVSMPSQNLERRRDVVSLELAQANRDSRQYDWGLGGIGLGQKHPLRFTASQVSKSHCGVGRQKRCTVKGRVGGQETSEDASRRLNSSISQLSNDQ